MQCLNFKLHKNEINKSFKQSEVLLFIPQLAPSHLVFKMSTYRHHTSHVPVITHRPCSTTTMYALDVPISHSRVSSFYNPGLFPSFSRKLWHKSPWSVELYQIQSLNNTFIFFIEKHFRNFWLNFQVLQQITSWCLQTILTVNTINN